MNNLTLFLLGLIFINIPACLSADKQCFSKTLTPSYPCCKGDKVIYTDKNGDWGVENGEWCGIGGVSSDTCFSVAMGYPCCKSNKVVYTDESGEWGIENNEWCGIGDGLDSCFSIAQGYPCCQSCKIKYTDESGKWGVEDGKWCGIKDSCSKNVEDIIQGDPDFDFSFLKLENNKENMLYSPLSIKYALRMLLEGAEGNTYTELIKLIGNEELNPYTNIDKVLSLANGLFIRDTYYTCIRPEYIDTLKEKYNADVVKDEFKSAYNANKWIEKNTLGIIKNMLNDNIVQNPETIMLLINALAIEMEWYSPFNCNYTSGTTFYTEDDDETIEATMMSRVTGDNSLSYSINDDVTVVTMDLNKYGSTQFEFMAIMPTKENLSTFIEKVTKETINEIDKNLIFASEKPYGVDITIPKFKFSYDLGLKKDLKNLGINDTFERNEANLSKMENPEELKQNLFVSDILHKADIEFTEKGVKAAAVTVVVILPGSAGPSNKKTPLYITIDRPFMFIIRDKNTKDIWFTGTVYKPNLWKDDQESYIARRY
ncbi:cellulosomal serpin precursor [Anaeromyces robustus]|jgi:serine protease inhibitor|uniref:Cellulosomal serpin n=1 Tax=Anaeromyces robustus TaxID=1754192 RepID=A0A1Y1VVN7_9FUNG|nr:cellulosomal serpin precursor [Anaeromyces robustus]|eukprot:ORX65340.1 cellulosomal serpin precursor [Anaeromyces robustus]